MFARCHRSMKKSDPAHSLQLIIITENKKVSGKCSCVAGAGGFCHHFIGLLFYLAHLFSSKVKTELTTFISTIFCEG